jgi:hypothetical protein
LALFISDSSRAAPLKKIFTDSELEEDAVIQSFRTTAADSKTYNTGKVTAEIARAQAESEFEKYRIVQDRLLESDFDRVVADFLVPAQISFGPNYFTLLRVRNTDRALWCQFDLVARREGLISNAHTFDAINSQTALGVARPIIRVKQDVAGRSSRQ